MKKVKFLVGIIVFSLLINSVVYAQDVKKEEFKPVYITVTTVHWNPMIHDYSDWKATEMEYFKNVTSQNDLIKHAVFLVHYFTADNSEAKVVSVYDTWEDIEKSSEVSSELVKKAWPDEEKRKAFFKKRNNYYSTMHSDEIYMSMPGTKQLKTESKKPLIYYVKRNQLSYKEGKGRAEYIQNVIDKDPLIKAYYPHRHFWGSDSRDVIEVFVLDNFDDIEKSFDKNEELVKAHWPDEDKRKAFFKEMNKAVTGWHADYIYRNVPELSKN